MDKNCTLILLETYFICLVYHSYVNCFVLYSKRVKTEFDELCRVSLFELELLN